MYGLPAIVCKTGVVMKIATLSGEPVVVDELSLIKIGPIRATLNCKDPLKLRGFVKIFFNKIGYPIQFVSERYKDKGQAPPPPSDGYGDDENEKGEEEGDESDKDYDKKHKRRSEKESEEKLTTHTRSSSGKGVVNCTGSLYDPKSDVTRGVVIASEGNISNVNRMEDKIHHKDSDATVHDDQLELCKQHVDLVTGEAQLGGALEGFPVQVDTEGGKNLRELEEVSMVVSPSQVHVGTKMKETSDTDTMLRAEGAGKNDVSIGFHIPELKEMNIVIQDEKECLFQNMESSQKEDMNVLTLTCCSN
jgi:hypothetical protein